MWLIDHTIELKPARAETVGAEQATGHFTTPGADQPGDAQHLACMNVETDVMQRNTVRIQRRLFTAQPFHRQAHGFIFMVGFAGRTAVKRHITPDHQADQLLYGSARHRAGAGKAAVLKHGKVVAELKHFVQAVGDINNAHPRSLSSRTTRCRLSTSLSLSAADGSSIMISLAFSVSARAISTICCCATLRRATGVVGAMLSCR